MPPMLPTHPLHIPRHVCTLPRQGVHSQPFDTTTEPTQVARCHMLLELVLPPQPPDLGGHTAGGLPQIELKSAPPSVLRARSNRAPHVAGIRTQGTRAQQHNAWTARRRLPRHMPQLRRVRWRAAPICGVLVAPLLTGAATQTAARTIYDPGLRSDRHSEQHAQQQGKGRSHARAVL